jgi:hypothetical protein|tara:strand:- start:556 stop:864 length:309 start_codon:yes stop_codon:yes gene_type:complete
MLTYTQTKECIISIGKEKFAEILKYINEEAIESAFECGIFPENIEDSYSGQYWSDEEFTQELLESCGDVPSDMPWYVEIDWSKTAEHIMADYEEHNGYYWRI